MGDDRVIRYSGRAGWRRRLRTWAPRRTFRLTVILFDSVLELWYRPRRGYHPAVMTARVGGRWFTKKLPIKWVLGMKRKSVGAVTSNTDVQHLAAIDSDVLSQFQAVVNHCCVVRYDDGSARQPGTVLIKTVGTAWVLVFKDPDGAAQLQVLGQSLDAALGLAQTLLESDDAPWEVDPWAKARNGKKKS